MPGSRSGPKTNRPSTSRTEISPQPRWLNTLSAYGGSVPRVVLQGHLHLLLGAVAVVGERHRVADLVLADRDDQLVDAVHVGVAHRGDDVAGLQARLLRRAVGDRGADERAGPTAAVGSRRQRLHADR